jgi:hypothetical protein
MMRSAACSMRASGATIAGVPTDAGRAGEQQMIERQLRKCGSDRCIAIDDAHFVGREVRSDQRIEELAGARRELGELQHRAIACGERRGERAGR